MNHDAMALESNAIILSVFLGPPESGARRVRTKAIVYFMLFWFFPRLPTADVRLEHISPQRFIVPLTLREFNDKPVLFFSAASTTWSRESIIQEVRAEIARLQPAPLSGGFRKFLVFEVFRVNGT
jgi:hypothetical protein